MTITDELTIKIVTTTKKSFWSTFINKNRYSKIKSSQPDLAKLSIDFSDCLFIEPFHLVSLACLIEEYYINNIRVDFITGNNLELAEFLDNVRFLTFWDPDRDRNRYIPSERKTSLSLWKISEEMISSYSNEAKIYFENNYLQDKDLLPLAASLSELFMNISDHSKSEISGFCLTQYYPNLQKIKFSVCDFGVGIPASINSYLLKKGNTSLEDTECILKSFELSFTTQSTPRNRGFGLDNIKTTVLTNNGSLRVVSNSAFYSINAGEIQYYRPKEPFSGTHFEIVLDVRNFNVKSDETEDFDFSN